MKNWVFPAGGPGMEMDPLTPPVSTDPCRWLMLIVMSTRTTLAALFIVSPVMSETYVDAQHAIGVEELDGCVVDLQAPGAV